MTLGDNAALATTALVLALVAVVLPPRRAAGRGASPGSARCQLALLLAGHRRSRRRASCSAPGFSAASSPRGRICAVATVPLKVAAARRTEGGS